MKPGCGKCFKVAEKNGNKYICPSCGDVVAQIPDELPLRMLNRKELDELARMLQGNIARLMLSDDAAEIEHMRDWAHRRIDLIADARIQQVYEPVLRKPTKEEESLFTPEFLESLFESGDEE